ncbi:Protein MAINTENANCE OF MERISTEMS, partial [Camellia lanceoleosa]
MVYETYPSLWEKKQRKTSLVRKPRQGIETVRKSEGKAHGRDSETSGRAQYATSPSAQSVMSESLDFSKWQVIFLMVAVLRMPEVIPILWLCLRGFDPSYPRGTPHQRMFFHELFSTTSRTLTGEHPGICFCGSRSITSLMRHESSFYFMLKHVFILNAGDFSPDKGYGSTVAEIGTPSSEVVDLVDLAGFGPLCTGLSRCPARRTMMAALVERWWDTPNSFHFSATEDLTMTPLDFAVLIGLDSLGGTFCPLDLHCHSSLFVHCTHGEGDYATYRHIYLMPPLTGVRTPTMRPASMPSSSRAVVRAADAPSSSRAGTSRGGRRIIPPIPPTYHHPGWPDMPTELMGWQYGTTTPIPIPIEPPVPGHRYPPVEYMDQVLEMVASLEGMVLRREVQLCLRYMLSHRPGHLGLLGEVDHLGLFEELGHLGLFEELGHPGLLEELGHPGLFKEDWYAELPEAVRDLVDLAGFGPFCTGLSRCPARRTLMAALVERWWDTTNSFHFSATGDLTMTPLDFAVLTGLDVGGWPIPYDEDMGQWEAAWVYLLGAHPPVDRASGRVRYTWFSSHFRRVEMEPGTPEKAAQYARGFLMFLFGTTLFADRGNTVGLYLLSALVDLSQVKWYDWGGAGLATLYCYISATSRRWGDLLGGYWRAWEVLSALLIYIFALHYLYTARTMYFTHCILPLVLCIYILHCFPQLWVYAYFSILAPEMVVEGPLVTPYSLVFEGQHRPRPRESLLYLRQYFDTVRWTEFLGERFLRQVWGYISQDPPSAPPVEMRIVDRLSSRDVVNAMLGTDALLHLEEGDYATYRHIYLMPLLTGVRTPTMRPAGMSSSSRASARAADAPSTSRAGTSRGGRGFIPPIPPTYHHPGWPDMPTELMGWQYGTTSPIPIPIEPPVPGHRYVRDPDSPLPHVEYMDQVLEMVASLEGMVLRREAQLSIMGFQ